jgi:Fe-S-cluster-containing dehydrogenase component
VNGILIVDEEKCDGCGWCIQACPYGGIMLHPDKGIVVACDLCGGDPKCVEFCPEEALELVSDDQAAEKKWIETIERIPSEVQKLTCLIKKREWASIFAEAEERARRLTGKLEEINRSFGKQKSKPR